MTSICSLPTIVLSIYYRRPASTCPLNERSESHLLSFARQRNDVKTKRYWPSPVEQLVAFNVIIGCSVYASMRNARRVRRVGVSIPWKQKNGRKHRDWRFNRMLSPWRRVNKHWACLFTWADEQRVFGLLCGDLSLENRELFPLFCVSINRHFVWCLSSAASACCFLIGRFYDLESLSKSYINTQLRIYVAPLWDNCERPCNAFL